MRNSQSNEDWQLGLEVGCSTCRVYRHHTPVCEQEAGVTTCPLHLANIVSGNWGGRRGVRKAPNCPSPVQFVVSVPPGTTVTSHRKSVFTLLHTSSISRNYRDNSCNYGQKKVQKNHPFVRTSPTRYRTHAGWVKSSLCKHPVTFLMDKDGKMKPGTPFWRIRVNTNLLVAITHFVRFLKIVFLGAALSI